MSNIGDYQALVAAFTVGFTSQYSGAVSVACKDAEELKNGVRASGTPVRMLLPYGGGGIIDTDSKYAVVRIIIHSGI